MFSAKKKFKFYKRNKKITKIQSLFRRRKAIKTAKIVKQIKSAVKIQTLCRKVLARKKFFKRKEYWRKISFIQSYWKFQFKKKIIVVKFLQKNIKKFIVS